MPTTTRVFNFSAGPAVLPVPVLEQAQRDLVALPGVGMSVMEISHRSKVFEDLLGGAVAGLRELAGVPANYRVLFLQGGASLQFSMVPMNLLKAGTTADYVDTGSWADKAVKDARRVGAVNVTGSTKADNYSRIPEPREIALTAGAAYVHITTNNTIEGTEWKEPPDTGDTTLVADASSNIFSRPMDFRRFGLIYAGMLWLLAKRPGLPGRSWLAVGAMLGILACIISLGVNVLVFRSIGNNTALWSAGVIGFLTCTFAFRPALKTIDRYIGGEV